MKLLERIDCFKGTSGDWEASGQLCTWRIKAINVSGDCAMRPAPGSSWKDKANVIEGGASFDLISSPGKSGRSDDTVQRIIHFGAAATVGIRRSSRPALKHAIASSSSTSARWSVTPSIIFGRKIGSHSITAGPTRLARSISSLSRLVIYFLFSFSSPLACMSTGGHLEIYNNNVFNLYSEFSISYKWSRALIIY
jgi:hypothetical protein